MTSRFLIDFPRATDQRLTLDNYLNEHFVVDADRRLRLAYLSTLSRVIESSTVQPMTMGPPERLATLHVIRQMSMHVLADESERYHLQRQQRHSEYLLRQQQQQQQQQQKIDLKRSQSTIAQCEVKRTSSSTSSPSELEDTASFSVRNLSNK
jgi:hypothetical protein